MQMHFRVMLYKWPAEIVPEIGDMGLIESRRWRRRGVVMLRGQMKCGF